MANIDDRVKEIIVEQLGVSEDAVKDEAKLIEDLGADSLDVVELVMALEETFDVTVDEDDQDGLEKVGQIISYVKDKAGEA